MKKIILVCVCVFLLIGCGKVKISEYDRLVNELVGISESSDDLPFAVQIKIDSLTEEELIYQVVIDEPKVPMYGVKAIVTHDYQTTDIFPSIGLGEENMNLIPNDVNEEEGKVKGIALIGYIASTTDFKGTLKVYVQYHDELGNLKKCYVVYKK